MRQTAEGHYYMRQGLQDEPKDDRTLIGGRPLLMNSLIVSKLGFGGLHRANSLRKGNLSAGSNRVFVVSSVSRSDL